MIARVVLVVVLVVGGVGRAAAQACDEARDARIRAQIERERRAARTWNVGFGAFYLVTAGAQAGFAAAEWAPLLDIDDDKVVSLWVGAGKSTIGLVSKLILPLETPRPAVIADTCASLAEAERALAELGRNQQKSFWLNALGGFAVNLGGAVIIQLETDNWTETATSFGIGIAVSVVTNFTQPRTTWRRGELPGPTATITVAPLVAPGATGLAVAGSF